MEKINFEQINKIMPAVVSLQGFRDGRLVSQSRGKNTITNRGLLEMVMTYILGTTGNAYGGWYQSEAYERIWTSTPTIPADMGESTAARYFLNLLPAVIDETAAVVELDLAATGLLFSHSLATKVETAQCSWDPVTKTLVLAWLHATGDWNGTCKSIAIMSKDTGVGAVSHKVNLAQDFVKTAADTALLKWTWTINI